MLHMAAAKIADPVHDLPLMWLVSIQSIIWALVAMMARSSCLTPSSVSPVGIPTDWDSSRIALMPALPASCSSHAFDVNAHKQQYLHNASGC